MDTNLLIEIENGNAKIDPNSIEVALDGGTISCQVEMADGNKLALYLDRRMHTETRDTFYASAYPGKEGSEPLGTNPTVASMLDQR